MCCANDPERPFPGSVTETALAAQLEVSRGTLRALRALGT
jgi:hypothetical protein